MNIVLLALSWAICSQVGAQDAVDEENKKVDVKLAGDDPNDIYSLTASAGTLLSANGYQDAVTNALTYASLYEPNAEVVQENNQDLNAPILTGTQMVAHALKKNKVEVLQELAFWKQGGGDADTKASSALDSIKELFSKEQVTAFLDEFATDEEISHPYESELLSNTTGGKRKLQQATCPDQAELNACLNQPVFHPIYLPIVFHVFGFRSGNVLQPAKAFENQQIYFDAIQKTNELHAASGSPIRFQIIQVRLATNPAYAYLVLPNAQAYQETFMNERLTEIAKTYDIDRVSNLNIYVIGDLRLSGFPPNRGIAWAFVASKWTQYVPSNPIAINFALLDPTGDNNAENHWAGPKSTAHEIGHHLGLQHTTTPDDCIADTPVTNGQSVWNQPWGEQASSFCLNYPQARGAQVPPIFGSNPGVADPIFNIMTYTYAWCRREFSIDQWKRMYCTTQVWRPGLFARGRQGVAARDEPAPGQLVSQSAGMFPCDNHCGETTKSCQCDRGCKKRGDCCSLIDDSCMADGVCCWNKKDERYKMFAFKDQVQYDPYWEDRDETEREKYCVPILYVGGAMTCPKISKCDFVEVDDIPDHQVTCYDGNVYRSKCFAKPHIEFLDGCEPDEAVQSK